VKCRQGLLYKLGHGAANGEVLRSLNHGEAVWSGSRAGAYSEIVRRALVVVMNAPIDSSSRLSMLVWQAFLVPIRFVPLLGSVYGAMLYPIELELTPLMSESPTT
jgi:hypothetical protein